MFTTIINDCRDENALTRQAARALTLIGYSVAIMGVKSDLEAAGNIIDILDASDGKKGVVIANVAPRQGKGKKWPNGTPFVYFYLRDTLVISTIDGYCLSLVKKFQLIKSVDLLDVPTVVDHMIKKGNLKKNFRDLIINSQFRSYDFVPRVAKWLLDGVSVPSKKYAVSLIENAPQAVWWVDNFGNCKTTVLPKDVNYVPGKTLKTKVGRFLCFPKLKDVPDNQAGIIVGSSGFETERFLELVIQGRNAGKEFELSSGSELF